MITAGLICAGLAALLAAALVLLASSPDKARAEVTQGLFPLIAVGSLAIALL